MILGVGGRQVEPDRVGWVDWCLRDGDVTDESCFPRTARAATTSAFEPSEQIGNKLEPSDSKLEQIALERKALNIGMAGNLFMGIAGIAAAYLSNSQAILMDGLFSLIGLISALMGKRIADQATRPADRVRPFGYAGDEAIFSAFRSLSLLGLVVFASVNSMFAIARYWQGIPPPVLVFEPMLIYFIFVGLTCLGLWLFQRHVWKRTGKVSDVLRLESKAAGFDGLITGAAAVGLVGIHLLQDGLFAPIAPVGDSLIVLLLCGMTVGQYWADFKSGLQELAGVTAKPTHIATVRRAIRDTLKKRSGRLHDLSVSKLGRVFTVMVYFEPEQPLSARDVDNFTHELQADVDAVLPFGDVFVIISEQGRVLKQR